MDNHTKARSIAGNGSKVHETKVRDINGRKLSRRLKKGLSPSMRALLALDVERGRAFLHHLTRAQLARLFEVSTSYIAAAAKLASCEREFVETGKVGLSIFYNKKFAPTEADIERVIGEFGIEAIITKIGIDKVFNVIDVMTAPTIVVSAEDNEPADWWKEIHASASPAA